MTLRLSRAGSEVAAAVARMSCAGFQMLMESGDLVKPALLSPNPRRLFFLQSTCDKMSRSSRKSWTTYLKPPWQLEPLEAVFKGKDLGVVFKMGDILTPGPYFIAVAGPNGRRRVALPFSTEIENDRGTFASRRCDGRGRRGKLVFSLALFQRWRRQTDRLTTPPPPPNGRSDGR